mgnify:CR=1 FL=1
MQVPHPLAVAGAWAWRLIAVAIVVLAALWVMREARAVLVPIVVATFVTRALAPVAGWLRRRNVPAGVAAALAMIAFAAVVGGLVALAVRSFAGEVDSLGTTLSEAVDDIEDWLVDDSPFDVSRTDVDSVRQRLGGGFDELVRSSTSGALAERATVVAEIFTGAVLSVILTFFLLRDGRRLADWVVARSGARARRVQTGLDAAWDTLLGYLRGAAVLGVTEAVIIGVTLWIVGADLIAPIMILTVLGAFVPIVGAIVAGVIAVLVALVTAGTGPALIVAVVALVVQQFDNDLLAPIIYGRALSLHPAFVLLSVVAGGALFGITGAVLAGPVVAVAVSVVRSVGGPPPGVAADAPDDAPDGEPPGEARVR